MCVDLDVDGGEEDKIEGDGDSETQSCVSQILEKEVERARERGNDVPLWLELEELGIDDDMLLSMDLSRKFPVPNDTLYIYILYLHFSYCCQFVIHNLTIVSPITHICLQFTQICVCL